MILGTAGHIDHGKTALVRALTGVDTDRLPEEQRRGITIELGFAPLVLPGVGTIGVVDVPGHEAFVRTMLAGASGIDLALLVVAADEGVMPQTREHLAILGLLGIPTGVIALTKVDLVDADWLALVRDDVAAAVAGSPLAHAPQVPVSAVTGVGLDELRRAIAVAAASAPHRPVDDLFRLPVDRAFTVRGTGTVVTGTVWSGQLRKDDTVRILPGDHRARVRGLQTHGRSIDVAEPGSRLAVNLGGVDVADVPRGSTLVTDGAWEPVDVVRADVAFLSGVTIPGPRSRIQLHLGTRDVAARVVAGPSGRPEVDRRGGMHSADGGPMCVTPVRIVLDEPIAARAGDRFVLRTGGVVATIGGGTITDAAPGHTRVRPWPVAGLTIVERIGAMVRDAGSRGLACGVLAVRAGVRPSDVRELVRALPGNPELIDGSLFDRAAVEEIERRVVELVTAHHERAPLEEGLSLQSLRSALKATAALTDFVLGRLVRGSTLIVERGLVGRHGHTVRLTGAQEAALTQITQVVTLAGREPPSVSELVASGLGQSADTVASLLRLLERKGLTQQVESDRYYSVETVRGLTEALRAGMVPGREYGPAELREFLGVSRKYLIPLLEYFDRVGVTERRSTGRVLAEQRGSGPGVVEQSRPRLG
jgi:selenocysteine-specific elongation factor